MKEVQRIRKENFATHGSEARQLESLAKDPIVQRSTTYFQENIARTTKAEELVKDDALVGGRPQHMREMHYIGGL